MMKLKMFILYSIVVVNTASAFRIYPSGNPLLNRTKTPTHKELGVATFRRQLSEGSGQELMCATFRRKHYGTYCGTPDADGTSLAACYDSSGIQIRQDRRKMFWDINFCSGVNCYDLQGALIGICASPSEPLESTTETSGEPAAKVRFTMKLGLSSEIFTENKDAIKSGIATQIGVPESMLEVSIRTGRRALRRTLNEVDIEVTILSNDAQTITETIESSSFASDLANALSESTGESIQVSDVSEPAVEEMITTTTENLQQMGRGATALSTCDSFDCGQPTDALHISNAANIQGSDFATCCQCQFGSNLLWGAHANGTFHDATNQMEMWLEIPADYDMQNIFWMDAQSDALKYEKDQPGEWERRENGQCKVRWALQEDLNTFFGAASHFTYDREKDILEGMFEFRADRSVKRYIGSHENVYKRHITQDVPVLFSLEKTAKVEATFRTAVTAEEYADIAITGIAEETFSADGEIVLDFNVLSSSCMEKSVTLKSGHAYVNGSITGTWSDESMWHPDGLDTASCSQDVTVTFKRTEGIFDLPLVFQFQIQAANDSGDYIDEEVNLHIAEPSILDSLPIQATMSFYMNEDRTNPAASFGLGHTVYGRITTTTVVSVDSIVLSSLTLKQIGYDNVEQNFDIMHLQWAEYQGEYPERGNHFDFSFMLKSTDLHITASGSDNHLASIEAAIEVTYRDRSSTNDRRQLAIAPANIDGSDASMEAMGSFAITPAISAADEEENVAALLSYKSHFLQWAAAGGFLALFLYCIRRQNRHQSEIYAPLIGKDANLQQIWI